MEGEMIRTRKRLILIHDAERRGYKRTKEKAWGNVTCQPTEYHVMMMMMNMIYFISKS